MPYLYRSERLAALKDVHCKSRQLQTTFRSLENPSLNQSDNKEISKFKNELKNISHSASLNTEILIIGKH